MAYSLKLHGDRVVAYLLNFQGLSRAGRVRLFAHLHSDLRESGDLYRNEPGRRLAPGSPFFWYHLILRDDEGDGVMRQFSFLVDDSPAKFGVLQVEFVHVT